MITIVSILRKNMYGVFVLRHYLFLEAHSFPRASLSENCLYLLGDNVHKQISAHIFVPNRYYCTSMYVCQSYSSYLNLYSEQSGDQPVPSTMLLLELGNVLIPFLIICFSLLLSQMTKTQFSLQYHDSVKQTSDENKDYQGIIS